MRRPVAITAGVMAVVVLLSGCASPEGPEWEAWKVADLASDALAEVINQRPDVDCGKEPITMYNGHEIRCDVLSPETKDIFGADVTIYGDEEKGFRANVKVDKYSSGSLQF
jgi:hypothetical protein